MELGPQTVGVDDASRFACWNGDQLEHPSATIGSDDQEPLLSVVLELDVSNGVLPCVHDVLVIDVVLSAPSPRCARVKGTFTLRAVKTDLTLREGPILHVEVVEPLVGIEPTTFS